MSKNNVTIRGDMKERAGFLTVDGYPVDIYSYVECTIII